MTAGAGITALRGGGDQAGIHQPPRRLVLTYCRLAEKKGWKVGSFLPGRWRYRNRNGDEIIGKAGADSTLKQVANENFHSNGHDRGAPDYHQRSFSCQAADSYS